MPKPWSAHRSASGVETMLKLFYYIVVLCAVFSTVAVIVLLLYNNKNSSFIYLMKTDELANGRDALLRNYSDQFLQDQPETQKARVDKQGLEACPDTPPNLLGPFHVDFNHKRTWDEVRKKVSALLEGGRHKPTECISSHKVAIIIPYRNRHDHLKHWLYYVHPMLVRQQLDYGIYVINQDGEGKFNRAKLMNVGFAEASKEYDYDCFVFSDVDLIPMDDRNIYTCFKTPRHLSVAVDKFDFKLPYNTIFGGVSSFSKDQFLKVNGYPNTYWGWGGEDDDMYKRIVFHGMTISRPDHMIGRYKMIKHGGDLHNEPNPKRFDQLNKAQQNFDKDGINSLNYTVKEIVKDKLYTFINVDVLVPKDV